jgi:cytosine/creatinine deaminase
MARVSLLLTGGRIVLADGDRPKQLDLAIGDDGRIAALSPSIPHESAKEVIDLGGRLVVCGLVDAHQHLDKSRTRALIENSSGTLKGASAAYRGLATKQTQHDILERAERTLDDCLTHGTIAIRSHTNIESDSGLRGIEAMVALREQARERMTLQVVAHLTTNAPRNLEACRHWLDDAVAMGVDVVGGVPQNADDPDAFLDLLFETAERKGLPLDMHIDEHLNANHLLFDAIIERTKAHGMQGRVTAGHCCALSAVSPIFAERIIAGLVEAGITVITLPAANLFLQGRDATTLPPRGLTRVVELLQAGVRVAAASDNIQDPFVPVGSGDLLETARWTVLAGHLRPTDLRTAFDMVSSAPAKALGLDDELGIQVGARADLLVTNAEDVEDLVATGAAHRAVFVAGRLVSGCLGDTRRSHE